MRMTLLYSHEYEVKGHDHKAKNSSSFNKDMLHYDPHLVQALTTNNLKYTDQENMVSNYLY